MPVSRLHVRFLQHELSASVRIAPKLGAFVRLREHFGDHEPPQERLVEPDRNGDGSGECVRPGKRKREHQRGENGPATMEQARRSHHTMVPQARGARKARASRCGHYVTPAIGGRGRLTTAHAPLLFGAHEETRWRGSIHTTAS